MRKSDKELRDSEATTMEVDEDLVRMSDSELRRHIKKRLSYSGQFWALLVKSAIAQKRNYGTNTCQCLTPIILVHAPTVILLTRCNSHLCRAQRRCLSYFCFKSGFLHSSTTTATPIATPSPSRPSSCTTAALLNNRMVYGKLTYQSTNISLSEPQDGNYRPSAVEILYTDQGVTGEVPIGRFDPYGGNGTGLLGAISNRTLSIKVWRPPLS
jgi:hypothetical protein